MMHPMTQGITVEKPFEEMSQDELRAEVSGFEAWLNGHEAEVLAEVSRRTTEDVAAATRG